MYAGYLAAYAVEQRAGLGGGDVAAHTLEHAVVDMLQCYVEVAAYIGVGGHHGEYVVGEVGRVGVVQAYALHALDGSEALQQPSQGALAVEVGAVCREVLRDDVEFASAPTDQRLHLGHYLVDRARVVAPGDERYGTEGAEAVAALGDFDVCMVGAGARALRQRARGAGDAVGC